MIEKVRRLLNEGDCRKEETAVKYREDEAFEEIKRRGKSLKQRHERRERRVLYGATACLAVALLGVLSIFAGVNVSGAETAYGAFLLPAEAGGYVLTAVIAFALGIMIAACIRLYRNKNDAGSTDDKNAQGNS